jgi:hypothetical protein
MFKQRERSQYKDPEAGKGLPWWKNGTKCQEIRSETKGEGLE